MTFELPAAMRVLLLEDDPLDAEIITEVLRHAAPGATVVRVETRAGFAETLKMLEPDVILSDHGVPGFDALDALELARVERPESPFLVVAGAFERRVLDCLKHGAADYVAKSELSHLAAAVSEALALRAPLRRLSARQRQVLQLVAGGVSTREIARSLRLSVKTVETHRALVMRRLDIHDLPGLVRYAVRLGLVSASR